MIFFLLFIATGTPEGQGGGGSGGGRGANALAREGTEERKPAAETGSNQGRGLTEGLIRRTGEEVGGGVGRGSTVRAQGVLGYINSSTVGSHGGAVPGPQLGE